MSLVKELEEKDPLGYLALRLKLRKDYLNVVFEGEPKRLPWSKKLQKRMLDDDDRARSKQSKTAKKNALARERRLAVVPEYISISLDGSEFRLLRLFSRRRSKDMSCELIRASLQGPGNSQQYAALSYTWGSEDKVANIIVDGEKREVRRNLERALFALRRVDEDLILWVDALCINQFNVSERNHQVTLMAKIYQQAKEVYVYLGESSHLIFAAMQIMREAKNDKRDSVYLRDVYWYHSTAEQDYGPLEKLRKDSTALKGLREMLQRPWFGRVWILQEAAHASSSTIFCGAQSVSTTLFRNALDAALIRPEAHVQAVLDLMQGVSRQNDTKVRNEDIASLVNRFKGSKATNERDRIYALRSMSSDAFASNYLRPAYQECVGCVVYTAITFILGYYPQDHILFRNDVDRPADQYGSNNVEPSKGGRVLCINFTSWNPIAYHRSAGLQNGCGALTHPKPDIVEPFPEHHRLDPILEPFLGWTVNQMADNLDNLSRIAIEWGFKKKNLVVLERLLPRYSIQLDTWEHPDDLTQQMTKYMIDTGIITLFKAIMDCYDPRSKSEGVSTSSRLPNLAMDWAIRAGNADAVKELIQRYDGKENCVDYWINTILRAFRWALKVEKCDIAKEVLQRYESWVDSYYPYDKGAQMPDVLAAKFGDMELLQMVLKMPKRYSWRLDEASIRVAYERQDEEMILLLLDHSYAKEPRPMHGDLFYDLLGWADAKSFKNLQQTFLGSWNKFFDRRWELNHLERLLDQGVEIDIRDYAGRTPFMRAIEQEQTEIASLLKERGAAVDAQDKEGETALSNSIATFALQKNGGCPQDFLMEKRKIFTFLLAQGASPNCKTKRGRMTLLHRVITEGLVEIMEILLAGGANVGTNQSPLYLLMSLAYKKETPLMFQLLLKYGADVEERDSEGSTPLMWAARHGLESICCLLLEYEAEVDSRDVKERTPLMYAISTRQKAIVEVLLQNGASFDTADEHGWSPLAYAASIGVEDIAELLLDRGATLEFLSKTGETALTYAAMNGHPKIVELLLNRGAMIDIADISGRTPLIHAAIRGHRDVIHRLLEAGASPSVADNKGNKPLDYAHQLGWTYVARQLERWEKLS